MSPRANACSRLTDPLLEFRPRHQLDLDAASIEATFQAGEEFAGSRHFLGVIRNVAAATLQVRYEGTCNVSIIDARLFASLQGSAVQASVKDVAGVAGVSPSTVSNYLLRPHLLSEETRSRVAAAITQVGFVPNESARQLRAGASKVLGLVLLDAWLPYFADLSAGVEDVARSRGWALFHTNSARDSERELANLSMFEAHRVQGIIISPQGHVSARLTELERRGIRCVSIGPTEPSRSPSSIMFDDFLGGEMAGDHLIEIGRQRIAFMGNPNNVIQSADRLGGLLRAVRRAQLPHPVVSVTVHDLTVAGGIEAARQVLTLPPGERPDAVFAANDMVALGAMTVFLQAGIRIPQDIAIVGFDDVSYASQAVIPLTSIRQPARKMGADAANMLIDRIVRIASTPQQIVHKPQLMVRASTVGVRAELNQSIPQEASV